MQNHSNENPDRIIKDAPALHDHIFQLVLDLDMEPGYDNINAPGIRSTERAVKQ